MDGTSQTAARSPKIKILSLDGGGVRGLSSLLILRRIMIGLGNRMIPPKPDIKPCEFFDLIGGTSTGGIIALMLGRLRMSVEECIKEYTNLSEMIFSKKKPPFSREKFYAERLESAIKRVIRRKLGDTAEDSPLKDPLEEEACKSLVFTLPKENSNTVQATALRTYSSNNPVVCTIWQAARATSAAPTYFESIKFGNPAVDWVDAGLGFNNPARALLAEAKSLWRDSNDNFNGEFGIFISLGTGVPKIIDPDAGWGLERVTKDIVNRIGAPIDWIRAMQAIALDSEKVAHQIRGDFHRSVYHRFNVEQGLQAIELYQYECEGQLTADTENYLKQHDHEINECTRLMATMHFNAPPLGSRVARSGLSPLPGSLNNNIALQHEVARRELNWFEFQIKQKQLKKNPEIQNTASFYYLWNRLVQADMLDKNARQMITDFCQTPEGKRLQASSKAEISDIAKWVSVQCKASKQFWEAYKLYHALRVSQLREFGYPSQDQFWTTHRLGGVSESLGLLEDALELYKAAWQGQKDLRSEGSKIQYSKEAMVRLQNHLNG